MKTSPRKQPDRRALRAASGLLALCACCGPAAAIEINTGNDDWAVRFDNTVRYTLGVRAQAPKASALANINLDDSDGKFLRGDLVANRFDLITELDAVYKRGALGVRISSAAWLDNAYRNQDVRGNAAFETPFGNASSAYAGNRYTPDAKRWNRGASGEFLDAFVFGHAEAGGIPIDAKLGQHNVYWGESLFSFVHGVAYSQGPVDIRKAFSNPGAQAKELFLPLNQLSAQAQLTPSLSLAGQYFFDWKASRIPDGGTYFGIQDFLNGSGNTYVVNPLAAAGAGLPGPIPFVGAPNTPRKRGDWGLKATWRPPVGDGTLGVYWREYTDKFPQIVAGSFLAPGLPSDIRLRYLEKNRLFGLSYAQEVGGVSIGSELTWRHNTGLLMSPAAVAGSEPRGNTFHGLINAVATLPRSSAFDFATLMAELTYSRMLSVRSNANAYNAVGYGCLPGQDKWDGCATRDAWGLALKFEPVWNQAMAGVDLSLPVVLSVGLKGNSPVLFGGYQGNGSYSVGLVADVFSKYNLALSYNGYLVRHKEVGGVITSTNGLGYFGDRGWVSLTFKSAF